MKINKKKTLIGAVSAMALATASFAVMGFNGVEASAQQTEYATNSAKWQKVEGMKVDSTYGLVPNVLSTNADVMSATSVNLSANSNGTITSDLSGGSYGVMAYYLKWNEGTDSVTWAWSTRNTSALGENEFGTKNLPAGSSIYPEKITASNVKGDWIAIILSYDIAPFVLECNNGKITQICDLWTSGFGPSDYNNLFNQETQVAYSIADTASGASYSMTYYTPDYGINTPAPMTVTGGVQNSTNANLKGEGALRIEKIIAGAEFTTGNSGATPKSYFKVAIEENASGDVGGGTGGGTTSTENWQVLSGVSEGPSSNVLVPNVAGDVPFKATSKNVDSPVTSVKITSDLKGGVSWGVMMYYLKWNEGTDSVTWDWTTNPDYPMEGIGGASEMGLKASGATGDWIAIAISHASAPLVIECKNGQMVAYNDDRIWTNGFGDVDYGQFFNQKTEVEILITETENGISMTATFDAVNAGMDKIGLLNGTYVSTNANLKGAGAVSIQRVKGNANFSNGQSTITADIQGVVAQKLETPTIAQSGTTIRWEKVENASSYLYTVDGKDEKEVATNFIECSKDLDGKTIKVKAIGDGVYYSDGDWSNEVVYDAPAEKMATPVVSVDLDGKASWSAIEGATSYSYKVNDGEVKTTADTFVQLSDGDTITVQAISTDTENYLASDWSTEVKYKAPVKLATPNVSVSESGLASWDEVTGATSYSYKINDGEEQTTTGLSVALTDGDSIIVKAVTTDVENYKDSDWSDAVTYNAPMAKLATPEVTIVGNEARWTADLNATKYVYKIGEDGEVKDANGNSVELTDGQTIYVKAVGDNSATEDSDWSTGKTYTAGAIAIPQVTIEGNVASWNVVEGAVSYAYKFGENGEVKTTSATSIALVHGQTLFVKAVGNGATSKDSDWSTAVSYTATALQTPVVVLNGDVASWNVVAGANGYKYKIGDVETTTTELSVILADGQSVQVKALGDNETSLDSAWSTVVSYTAPEDSETPNVPSTPDTPDTPVEPDEPNTPVVPDDGETFTVAEVTAMIAELPTIVNDRQAYTRVRSAYLIAKEAYYTLSAEDMALVENASVLTTLQETLNAFKAKVDKADAVDAMVTAIPTTTITAENYGVRKAQITAANEAYNALTEEEKELCKKATYLNNRMMQLAEYEANPEDEKGCGSSIGGFALAGVALAGLAVIKRKKKED